MTVQHLPRTTAWWSGHLSDLIVSDADHVVAQLASSASAAGLPARRDQIRAWREVVDVLKAAGAALPL